MADDKTVLIYVGTAYPNQDFSVLISNSNISKFDLPETYIIGKQIKVTGKVIRYRK